jgi:hypothetical protein
MSEQSGEGGAADKESYHGYSVDDETQPQDTGDSLVDDDRGIPDPMDEGWNPPEKWSAGQRYGNTPLEEALGETLDQRLAPTRLRRPTRSLWVMRSATPGQVGSSLRTRACTRTRNPT